jgi:hypothetical protein
MDVEGFLELDRVIQFCVDCDSARRAGCDDALLDEWCELECIGVKESKEAEEKGKEEEGSGERRRGRKMMI